MQATTFKGLEFLTKDAIVCSPEYIDMPPLTTVEVRTYRTDASSASVSDLTEILYNDILAHGMPDPDAYMFLTAIMEALTNEAEHRCHWDPDTILTLEARYSPDCQQFFLQSVGHFYDSDAVRKKSDEEKETASDKEKFSKSGERSRGLYIICSQLHALWPLRHEDYTDLMLARLIPKSTGLTSQTSPKYLN